jgi:CRP-like cAMP-binding protein
MSAIAKRIAFAARAPSKSAQHRAAGQQGSRRNRMMGSPGSSMMTVLTGSVRISIPSQEGREIVLAVLQPGEVFGEIAVLDGKERALMLMP